MKSNFTSDFFRGNRERLRALCKDSLPIVLTANGLLQRNSDNTFRFRQDSSFWYLTGVTIADAILVIDKNKEYIIIPDQEDYQRVFDGPILEDEIKATSGVDEILSEKKGWSRLKPGLKRTKCFSTLEAPKPYIDFYKFYTNPARASLIGKVKEINSTIKLVDIRQHVTGMRMVKQPAELKAMKKAIAITIDTVESIRTRLPSYKSEFEIEAELSHGFRIRGATGHAFHPIVAAGKNACIIHYYANNDTIGQARFVLLDVGAEVENYAADLGCTYWITSRNKRENDVYNAVIDVQVYAYSLLKPGVIMKEYEKQIEQYMGKKLVELGLITTTDRAAVRKYFPHAASHHVGLDAHDIADYETPLAAGMVLAVEPGIYIPEEKIGVRIEHNVLITNNGMQILTKRLVQ